MDIEACFASGYTAEGIIGKRKNSKDAPLLRDLIQDTWVLIEEEKKSPGARWIETPDLYRLRDLLTNPFATSTAEMTWIEFYDLSE